MYYVLFLSQAVICLFVCFGLFVYGCHGEQEFIISLASRGVNAAGGGRRGRLPAVGRWPLTHPLPFPRDGNAALVPADEVVGRIPPDAAKAHWLLPVGAVVTCGSIKTLSCNFPSSAMSSSASKCQHGMFHSEVMKYSGMFSQYLVLLAGRWPNCVGPSYHPDGNRQTGSGLLRSQRSPLRCRTCLHRQGGRNFHDKRWDLIKFTHKSVVGFYWNWRKEFTSYEHGRRLEELKNPGIPTHLCVPCKIILNSF